MFGVGILLAAGGAGLVLYSKGYLDQKSREAKQAASRAPVASPVPAPLPSEH